MFVQQLHFGTARCDNVIATYLYMYNLTKTLLNACHIVAAVVAMLTLRRLNVSVADAVDFQSLWCVDVEELTL